MADYIEREAVIRDIESRIKNYQEMGDRISAISLKFAMGAISAIPAADVAEVVRCKDCDAWKRNVGIVDSPNGHCFEHDIDTNGQDFCSYGKRRGGGDDNVPD